MVREMLQSVVIAASIIIGISFQLGLCSLDDAVANAAGDDLKRCRESERVALLALKANIGDAHTWLSSWTPLHQQQQQHDDCCRWKGVGCDPQTGHVIKLDLHYPYLQDEPYYYFFQHRPNTSSKVSPSLLNLTHLRYLDLSGNDFNFTSIPEFIGSLANLQYLNLSWASFSGMIPPQLGNISGLRFLDLSYNGYFGRLIGGDITWLTSLPLLQHLDMSRVHLSRAINWLGVVNMLPSLSVLRLSGCELPILPTTLAHVNFTSLATLHLSSNNFPANSKLPEWLFGITTLISLDLGFNNLHGPVLQALGNMTSLEILGLVGNNLEGAIPTRSLGKLNNLRVLSLFYNDLSGVIPESIGNLTNLQEVYLGGNNIGGRLPESMGNLHKLTKLLLSSNDISGHIPTTMGNLCNLRALDLYNNKIRGEVTGLVRGLTQCVDGSSLEELDLHSNQLMGYLPYQLGQLKNLKRLNLQNNSLCGVIPASLGALSSLEELLLGDNKLNGTIPRSLGLLSNLFQLDISFNSLTGELSEDLFVNLTQLSEVDMSFNSLSFNVSSNWVPPFQLRSFKVAACQTGPKFPSWLLTQKNLHDLDLSSNGISDVVPDLFWTSSTTWYLNFSHNQLKGKLRSSSGSIIILDLSSNNFAGPLPLLEHPLQYLDLSNNSLYGPIPLSQDTINLEFLDVSHNHINGSIPLSICNMQYLQILDLSDNDLPGKLPHCLGNSSSLQVVDFSNNNLSGNIPYSVGSLAGLSSLHLRNNSLTEEIPASLQNCERLITLDLGENRLIGKISTWIGGSLSSLVILSLRSNMLHGSIPTTLSQLQYLQVLDLACNQLSGPLVLNFLDLSAMVEKKKTQRPIISVVEESAGAPSAAAAATFEESISIVPKGKELEYTTILSLVTSIDLSNNGLSGEIPEEITSLHGLHFLNLSLNHFMGHIPENINAMESLESLDISMNQISGVIPSSMSSMTLLGHLNMSHNNLSGKIPSGGQMQTFEQSSYLGNGDLCGSPLTKLCPAPDSKLKDREGEDGGGNESDMIWLYVSMALGFAAGFWGFIGVLSIRKNNRVAYFRFIDDTFDGLYVAIVVHSRRLKRKMLSWMSKGNGTVVI